MPWLQRSIFREAIETDPSGVTTLVTWTHMGQRECGCLWATGVRADTGAASFIVGSCESHKQLVPQLRERLLALPGELRPASEVYEREFEQAVR